MPPTFEVTVFSEPQGEAAARLFVVARPTSDFADDELAAYHLSGHIVGPTCRYSSTLQTKVPFHHRGFTQCGFRTAIVAEVLLPDPCYWSPELPFLYRAIGEISGDLHGTAAFDQSFGIRSMTVVRKRFTLNGKYWVPRIVYDRLVVATPLEQWRESDTVMHVGNVDEALGKAASEIGVHLVAAPEQRGESAADVLFRLSRFPAVGLVFAGDAAWPVSRDLQTAARNNLFGRCDVLRPVDVEQDATSFGCLVLDDSRIATETMEALNSGVPLLALRQESGTYPLAEARAICDAMQRDLARQNVDPAGYIVT